MRLKSQTKGKKKIKYLSLYEKEGLPSSSPCRVIFRSLHLFHFDKSISSSCQLTMFKTWCHSLDKDEVKCWRSLQSCTFCRYPGNFLRMFWKHSESKAENNPWIFAHFFDDLDEVVIIVALMLWPFLCLFQVETAAFVEQEVTYKHPMFWILLSKYHFKWKWFHEPLNMTLSRSNK